MNKFGFLSVDTCAREIRARVRVVVNGVDVTRRCYAANDIDGWADCFQLDDRGRFFIDRETCEAARERLTGDVVIDFPQAVRA
jgi:hypothetical protein